MTSVVQRTLTECRPSPVRDIVTTDSALAAALEASASRHEHLCPRQVLGARIGIAGIEALALEAPTDKRVLVFIETDGCFADGIEAATGCSIGHRTLRLEDYGRVAATFVSVDDGRAVRVAPAPGIRERALLCEPLEQRRYYAQLRGYQTMPGSELLTVMPVTVRYDIAAMIGRKGTRVDCGSCGEEVINQRERLVAGVALCPACTRPAYYEEGPPQA
jgi:formylmethanofuran dehydrogenase subunit E